MMGPKEGPLKMPIEEAEKGKKGRIRANSLRGEKAKQTIPSEKTPFGTEEERETKSDPKERKLCFLAKIRKKDYLLHKGGSQDRTSIKRGPTPS